MSNVKGEKWFCELVDSGLNEEIFDSAHLMSHATPEVLAENLPPDLVAKVLQSALQAGAMTTDRILETLTPEIAAHHIPHAVLWECVSTAAKKVGLDKVDEKVKSGDKRRAFLRRSLDSGLACNVVSPGDVVEHATAEVLAEHLPVDLKAKLLSEALKADAMNPSLIVDVVGVKALTEHVPVAVLWECLVEAGEKAVTGQVVGAVASVTDDKKKGAKSSKPKGGPKALKKPAARAGGNKKDRALTPPTFDDDTNVNDWAGAEDFEVVEEEDLGALTDSVLGSVGPDWHDDETNVGS
jgi:hypothetical protein